jgi:hypothetical protein
MKADFLVAESLRIAKVFEAYANLKEEELAVDTPPFDEADGDKQETFNE